MKTGEQATTGPWGWVGNTGINQVHLATLDRGRQFVMGFHRWGMQSAQPTFQVDQGYGGIMVPVKDLVIYEVPYRKDFYQINHPDALLIQAAPDLLAAAERVLASAGPTGERWEGWRVKSGAMYETEKAVKLAREGRGK